MGQKLSTNTSNWTVDDWAFGTADNVVPPEAVVEEVRQIPLKYFGGQTIQNDASMQQVQTDLLSFDDTLKRLFFRRKKTKKQSKEIYYPDEEYYTENEQYYDQGPETIPEAEEEEEEDGGRENERTALPPIYANTNEEAKSANSSWKCKHCTKQNKSTDTECQHCEKIKTKF